MRCAPVALVETTGCWFTPAPQCEQESGARTGFRLPENSLDSAGGLSCSFRHATKRHQGGGAADLALLHGQIRSLGSRLYQ